MRFSFHFDIRQNVEYLLPCRSSMGRMKEIQIDLLQGTLDLLTLKTLQSGPIHGWDTEGYGHAKQTETAIKGALLQV
jgi:hypothetical protein